MLGAQLHPSISRWLGQLARVSAGNEPNTLESHDVYRRARFALAQADVAAHRLPQRFSGPSDYTAWAALVLLHPGITHDAHVAEILSAAVEPGESASTLHALCVDLNDLCLNPRNCA